MPPIEWQRALRRQFGREQAFELENIGTEPLFSEFRVSNPASQTSYHVAIRGTRPGDNFCACPDFATNELGTCKHIEFTLARLEQKRGAKAAFARGYQPVFSELYSRNEGTRTVHFRSGTDCPASLARAATALFDATQRWCLPLSAQAPADGAAEDPALGADIGADTDTPGSASTSAQAGAAAVTAAAEAAEADGDTDMAAEKAASRPQAAADTSTNAGQATQAAGAEAWSGLLHFGVQLAATLSAPADGATTTHTWVERDPASGTRSLRLPLPPPEAGRRIADALAVIVSALRGADTHHQQR